MLTRNQYIILSAAVVVVILSFPEQLWIAPLIGLYFFFLFLFEDKFIIVFSIISFLTLTSTINPQLRLAVQLLNIASLAWLFLKDQNIKNLQFRPVPKELLIFLSAIIIWMVISSLFSSYTKEGLEQVLRSVIFFPVVYLIYTYIKSVKEVQLILFSLIFVALFYSLFLFYQLYQNNFVLISIEEQLSYVFGMQYLDKNFLGGFISMAIILLFSYLFYSVKHKYPIIVIIIICFVGVILSNSRAAILSLIVASFILLWMLNRKVFYKTMGVVLVVLIIFFLTPLSDYFFVYARFESISSGRDYLVTAAENVIKNHFFLGAGPSGTRFEMYNHLPFMLGSPEEMFIRKNFFQSELGQAHSFYLFYFTDLGIIGFLISILFPVLYFRFSLKTMRYYTEIGSESYFITRSLFAIGVLMFSRGLLEWGGIFTFGNFNQDLPFWLILSVLTFFYSRIEGTSIRI